jgi:PhnB protein
MRVEPYLYFNGRCEDAIAFYRGAIGAEVAALLRVKDTPGAQESAGTDDETVMHADLRIGDTTLLVSDQPCHGAGFQGFSLSLTAPGDAEADRLFAALSDGGRVQMPLMATHFASRFGMVADRFGVLWTIAAYEQAASANA